jgi:preprotein translocase subunit YajC
VITIKKLSIRRTKVKREGRDSMKKRNLFWMVLLVVVAGFIYLAVEKISTNKESKQNIEKQADPASLIKEEEAVDYYTPEQFGANGFDKKLDTEALQKAIDKGDKVVLKSGATYIIDEALVSDHSISIVSENSENPSTILQKSSARGLVIDNNEKANTFVTERINYNQNYVMLYDTKGLVPGDLLHLVSSKLWYWDNRNQLKKGELHKITKIEGNKVYLDTNTQENYDVGPDESVTASVYPKMSLELKNITFLHPEPFNTIMVEINNTSNALLDHISVENSKRIGIFLRNTYQTEVHNANIKLGTTQDVTSGYGISDYGGYGTLITDSVFAKVRRGVDFSGDTPSRYGKVTNSKAFADENAVLASGNSGFGTHSTADHITFENNYVENFIYGFVSRGTNITFINNKHVGMSRSFLAVSFGNHVNILNNQYQGTKNSNLESFILLLDSYKGTIAATGNSIKGYKGPIVKGDMENLQSLIIKDNIQE